MCSKLAALRGDGGQAFGVASAQEEPLRAAPHALVCDRLANTAGSTGDQNGRVHGKLRMKNEK